FAIGSLSGLRNEVHDAPDDPAPGAPLLTGHDSCMDDLKKVIYEKGCEYSHPPQTRSIEGH
nr:hypothetical protein [Pseudomonadales bacterium]